MDVHGSMSIMFKADLSHLCAHRPAALYFVIQPGSNVGGVGAGIIRMVRPWNEWLINWGYDNTDDPPVIDDDAAARIARNLIGEPNIDIDILGVSLWGINEMWATHLQSGRVFCVGDAIHRHPPGNALGANTSVQDSYNLVWKIAAVLHGHAGPSLLETYSVERAPIARQIVKRANQSPRDWGKFYAALGLADATDVNDMAHQIDLRKENSTEGQRRRAALVEALDFKNYEFNTHGHDMGQFYDSDAVVADGSKLPDPLRDPQLYYQQSTVPGSHLPHAWVGNNTVKLATMDIAPYSRFTLITGIAGQDWVSAAEHVSAQLGIAVDTVVIGPGRAVTDLYYDWAKVREVDESGALLIRPDKHVAWRAMTMPADPAAALQTALAAVLGRKAPDEQPPTAPRTAEHTAVPYVFEPINCTQPFPVVADATTSSKPERNVFMTAANLEQMIHEAGGDVVGMLRNAPMGTFAFPYQPEYSNWRDEQEAWATTAVLFDQSTHMTDVYFKGPDVKRLFSEAAVNDFTTFGRNRAKQFVGVSEDGYVIGDGILFGLEDDQYSLVGTGVAGNWVAYRAQTGGYDVEVTFDRASVINPNPRKIFRFQIQGPSALQIVEKACDSTLPTIKFFAMGEFTIDGVPIRALNHTMIGQPGLEHTGLEMIGPLDEGALVWSALVEAGAEFGLKQAGGLAYPTTALETGWIPFPVPAIYTGDAMKDYREHLDPMTLEANYALAGSQVLPRIEDYYVTPWDIGYGRLIHFDHDFIGRDALINLADTAHAKKVWLWWNPQDCARVLADSCSRNRARAAPST